MVERAQIPNLTGLTELANRDGVDIKPTLLRVMTDLYVQKPVHTIDEENHYIELAMRLVDQVDAATRTIVANRLASYQGAPQAIVAHLARDRAQRGEPGPVDMPLPGQAELHQEAPAQADHQYEKPARAEPTPVTASPVTLNELSELFLTADSEGRRMILLNLDYANLAPAEPIAPHLAQEAIRRLEMAALTHSYDAFADEVERSLRINRALARRLIEDESGEPILAVAQALGMPADVLQRILLCLNPAISHSVLRVYELSTLYEELDPHSSLQLVAIWQATHRPVQQPVQRTARVHYDDGKDQAAMPVRPAIRWEEHALRRVNES